MNTERSPMYTAYLEGSLVLSKTGDWWHNGSIFENERLAKLFHKSICFDQEQNKYVVRIGAQQATFTCEDTAFFVTEIKEVNGSFVAKLLDESEEVLALESLSLGGDDQIYCQIKGGHRARLTRGAHQTLVANAVDDSHVCLAGKTFELKRK